MELCLLSRPRADVNQVKEQDIEAKKLFGEI